MIKSLKLENVGALPDATINFGKRLNIITGDNGLGKSFLLDVIWFGLTGCWPIEVNGRMTSGYMARPMDVTKEASIEIIYDKKGKMNKSYSQFKYERQDEKWHQSSDVFIRYSNQKGILEHLRVLHNYIKLQNIISDLSNNQLSLLYSDSLINKLNFPNQTQSLSADKKTQSLSADKKTQSLSADDKIQFPSADKKTQSLSADEIRKWLSYADEIREYRKIINKMNSNNIAEKIQFDPNNTEGIEIRPDNLVLYAHYDGSFSVKDSTRGNQNIKFEYRDLPHAFVFTPSEVWDGVTVINNDTGKEIPICNGLIRDWVSWQDRHKDDSNDEFSILTYCLEKLSPPDFSQKLAPAEHGRISTSDSREHPFIQMPYGNIPAVWASAGIRRILTLAYMLTWTITEHMKSCDVLGEKPVSQMTFLFDEVDAHLHPKWQRQIMGGILSVLESLTKSMTINTQIISVTHSPLVMASLEALFDKKTDKWLDLDLNMANGNVQIEERKLIKMGEASSWLTSDAFDLKSTYSIEAELAMNEYNKLMSQEKIDSKKLSEIIKKLEKLLPDTDPFWVAVDFPKTGDSK